MSWKKGPYISILRLVILQPCMSSFWARWLVRMQPVVQTVMGSVLGSFVEIDHEIISTAILSLPLIQIGQLSVTGERSALNTGLSLRKPVQEQDG